MYRAAATLIFCMIVLGAQQAAGFEPKQSKPFYNPASKSYFQLFDDNIHPGHWQAARERATQKVFKGVHGRLAVIDSQETHNFVMQHFGLTWRDASVWIGLRYWCSVRMLQWEGSRPFPPSEPGAFSLWHTPWSRLGDDACLSGESRKAGFSPVYYRNIAGVVRWQAVAAAKYFDLYLVEFVTDGE
jgi:hypothetical protein